MVINKLDRVFERFCDVHFPKTNKFSRNLTALAARGKLDRAYNREKECERLGILTHRKSVPNVLLVGKAGCEKTAIVEQYAINTWSAIEKAVKAAYFGEDNPTITETDIQRLLIDNKLPFIFEIDVCAMVGGTKYRGEFEERLQDIMEEVKRTECDVILFVDEVHNILDAGGAEGANGAAQYLKPALAKGEVRMIGATTTDEVFILARDKAFMRRFNIVNVAPITGNVNDMATKIAKSYARYHHVNIAGLPISKVVELVNFHLEGSIFPNNFINIIDEAFATAAYHGKKNIEITDITKVITDATGHLIVLQ